MPTIDLKIPTNSRFHSSLNEIDLAIGSVLLNQMRIADPRKKGGDQNDIVTDDENWLWDESRVFQVDELTTEEIFDTYLLRKNINKEKNVDVNYPLLAYLQNDIETAFWGTGNRYKQWYFDIPINEDTWEEGDTVIIATDDHLRGTEAQIFKIHREVGLSFEIAINGEVVKQREKNLKIYPRLFSADDLRPTGKKVPSVYKAKAITGTYTAVVLCKTRDEAQYIRDKFILRCADAQIWHKYSSPTINGAENQIFTVFGIPNINRYPTSKDKLKGEGYIYGTAFNVNVWGCLTDAPLPQHYIEMIRMNIHVEREDRVSRIVIS